MGHPVATPSWTPDNISHSSNSFLVDNPFLPGLRFLISFANFSLSISVPGGIPSISTPTHFPWLSPNKVIIVDANEAFNIDDLKSNTDLFVKTKIDLIEQPLISENDNELKGLNFPISICADESFHDSSDWAKMAHKYNTINIKLDKTGGLSEAVKIVKEAKKLDLNIMLGCMVSSSLSMLPLLPLYEYADFIDLDGPCFIANDRKNGIIYENGMMLVKEDLCWGWIIFLLLV